MQTVRRGNPKVPTPTRDTFPKPVVLKYAKARFWSEFERNTSYWDIEETNGSYVIKQSQKRPDKGWDDEAVQTVNLPPGAGLDELADKVASIVRTAAGLSPE